MSLLFIGSFICYAFYRTTVQGAPRYLGELLMASALEGQVHLRMRIPVVMRYLTLDSRAFRELRSGISVIQSRVRVGLSIPR